MKRSKTIPRNDSGSPHPGEPEYLLVGLFRRPHGLHGDLVLQVVTDFPERLVPGVTVYVGRNHLPCRIQARRQHAQGLLVRLDGIDSPAAAGRYKNEGLYVTAADRPTLPPGCHYHHEILGCHIVDTAGTTLGEVAEVLSTGANDVYVVRCDATHELLLPAIADVILQIDVSERRILVRVPPGLQMERRIKPTIGPRRYRTKHEGHKQRE